MPNFALVKRVGGPRRSVNFYLDEINQRHAAGMQRRQQEMELQDAQEKRGERETLRSIVQRSNGNWGQASKDAAAVGVSPESVMALQDRARSDEDRVYTNKQSAQAETDRGRKEAVDRLSVAGKILDLSEGVTDQASYDEYRTGAAQLAQQYGLPFNVPEIYDPAYIESKRKTAEALHRTHRFLTDAEERKLGLDTRGTYQTDREGKVSPINDPSKGRLDDKEVWRDLSVAEAKAAGFPDGAVAQRSSRGKLNTSYKPGTDNEKPTNASRKLTEMLKLGYPPSVAQSVAFGTVRQVQDARGNTMLIDLGSGQPIGQMGRDLATGSTKWIPAGAGNTSSRAPHEMSDDELLQSLGIQR